MTPRVTPMIHVPDVRATVQWYESIGFELLRAHEEGGVLDWASLSFGSGEVMLSSGGEPSSRNRRDVDLYVHTEGVDALSTRLRGRVEIQEGPHDTFYGMRELIMRDLNGFWVTFGESLDRESNSAIDRSDR